MPDLAPPDGQLAAENAALRAENADLRTENAALRVGHDELERVLAALMERVAELERQLASGFVEFLPTAVIGCAVVEEASKEALVAQQVGAQARQAARRVVVLAEPYRRRRGHAGDPPGSLPTL